MTDGKPKRERKPRLPAGLREIADAARAEHEGRSCAPRIKIEKTKKGWRFSCPYSDRDGPQWEALLFQAFGTRSGAIMDHFLEVFTELVGDGEWDDKRQTWLPKQGDFDAMIAIIHSLQPQNEAQAAHAAQLCALHLSAMKLGKSAARYGDERTAAIFNKTVRAYGDGMERLARLQGRLAPREVNQTIQVVYVDQRDQRIQIAGGVPPNGGQPHASDGGTLVASASLPSEGPHRLTVPSPSRPGQAGLPDAWWGQRIWRALRRGQRFLSERRLDG